MKKSILILCFAPLSAFAQAVGEDRGAGAVSEIGMPAEIPVLSMEAIELFHSSCRISAQQILEGEGFDGYFERLRLMESLVLPSLRVAHAEVERRIEERAEEIERARASSSGTASIAMVSAPWPGPKTTVPSSTSGDQALARVSLSASGLTVWT